MIRPRPLVPVLTLVLVLAALLGSAGTVHADGGTIKVGKPTVDPAPLTAIAALQPLTFSVKGAFKPNDEEEEPWVRFVWNFGDGTAPVSATYFGPGTQTDTVTHTYTQGGTYTVTLTAGHGFDLFFGFKFQKTQTFKVNVQCPGFDPGPKKCAKGTFSPFVGVWHGTGDLPSTVLTIREQIDKVVIGELSYNAGAIDKVTIPFVGKAKFKGKGDDEELQVKFDAIVEHQGVKQRVDGTLFMDISRIPAIAYRSIVLFIEGAPGVPDPASATFVLHQRTSDTEATLCATIGASKRSIKPGKELAFAIIVGNEGHATLPNGRAHMDVTVEGGTLVENLVVLDRVGPRGAGFNPHSLTLEFDSLGPGKKRHAFGESFFVVVPDPGAKQIAVTATVSDDPAANDAPFTLKPPAVRKVCVPVIE